MPPLKHLTCSGEEGTGCCNKPPVWRKGGKREDSVVAGRTGTARNPCLGQPVWQLPALLQYVQCETLPWSLSSAVAPGWDGHWQNASSWVLLGASGLFGD